MFSSNLVACVCEDATLYLIRTQYGTQLCCPIQLESKAAVLKVNGNFCMCMTMNGFVYVWKCKVDKNDNSYSKIMNSEESNGSVSNEFHSLTTLINKQSCENILRGRRLSDKKLILFALFKLLLFSKKLNFTANIRMLV